MNQSEKKVLVLKDLIKELNVKINDINRTHSILKLSMAKESARYIISKHNIMNNYVYPKLKLKIFKVIINNYNKDSLNHSNYIIKAIRDYIDSNDSLNILRQHFKEIYETDMDYDDDILTFETMLNTYENAGLKNLNMKNLQLIFDNNYNKDEIETFKYLMEEFNKTLNKSEIITESMISDI